MLTSMTALYGLQARLKSARLDTLATTSQVRKISTSKPKLMVWVLDRMGEADTCRKPGWKANTTYNVQYQRRLQTICGNLYGIHLTDLQSYISKQQWTNPQLHQISKPYLELATQRQNCNTQGHELLWTTLFWYMAKNWSRPGGEDTSIYAAWFPKLNKGFWMFPQVACSNFRGA